MFKSKESTIAVIVTILLLASLGMCLFFMSGKDSAEDILSQEKIKSEKMLSEKLALSKEIEQLNDKINSESTKNGALSNSVKDLQSQLAKKESQLKSINSVYSERDKYKKQLEALMNEKKLTDQQLAELSSKLKSLESNHNDAKFDAALLKNKNDALAARNEILSSLMANNYGLEAHKKGEKLTVKAKRTKELVAGFDLPVSMTENLKFTITNPTGKRITSDKSKSIHYVASETDEVNSEMIASTNWKVESNDFTKRIVLTYKPEEKLEGGVYNIDIYAAEVYLGSSQIRLK
jgi:small-conductance mechanosensitive channel